MSRVVVVIDSNTGAVIDVAGNKRETGRYAKFIKRMLSLDKNPTLDFGSNGGNTLTIARNGGVVAGTTINLVAETVKVSGNIKDKDGRTMEQIASDQFKYVLDRIVGTTGEIDVYDASDGSSSGSSSDSSSDDSLPTIQIALNESIVNRIKNLEDRAGSEDENYITKEALLEALKDISVEDDDDFETVKQQFAALLRRLRELAGDVGGSSSGSSGSSSSSSSSSSSGSGEE